MDQVAQGRARELNRARMTLDGFLHWGEETWKLIGTSSDEGALRLNGT